MKRTDKSVSADAVHCWGDRPSATALKETARSAAADARTSLRKPATEGGLDPFRQKTPQLRLRAVSGPQAEPFAKNRSVWALNAVSRA